MTHTTLIVDLSCSSRTCDLPTCPDCGECVRFCNCIRANEGHR